MCILQQCYEKLEVPLKSMGLSLHRFSGLTGVQYWALTHGASTSLWVVYASHKIIQISFRLSLRNMWVPFCSFCFWVTAPRVLVWHFTGTVLFQQVCSKAVKFLWKLSSSSSSSWVSLSLEWTPFQSSLNARQKQRPKIDEFCNLTFCKLVKFSPGINQQVSPHISETPSSFIPIKGFPIA